MNLAILVLHWNQYHSGCVNKEQYPKFSSINLTLSSHFTDTVTYHSYRHNLTFMGPCIINVFLSTTNEMQRYTIFFIVVSALHVSTASMGESELHRSSDSPTLAVAPNNFV